VQTAPTTDSLPFELQVTNSNGCQISVRDTLSLQTKPVAGFRAVVGQCLRDSVTFQDTSSFAAGTIGTRFWELGQTTLLNPGSSFAFDYSGQDSTTAALRIQADNGCRDTATQTLALPRLSFTINQSCVQRPIDINPTITYPGDAVSQVDWDWQSGTSSMMDPEPFNLPQAGETDIRVIVSTDSGCADTVRNSYYFGATPVPSYQVLTAPCKGEAVGFRGTSTVADTNIAAQLWNVNAGGIGAEYTGPLVEHTYLDTGMFQVQLIAEAAGGCRDTLMKTIDIGEAPVVSVMDTLRGCAGQRLALTYEPSPASPRPVDSLRWTYNQPAGAGFTSLNEPRVLYDSTGVYTAFLASFSPNGCADRDTFSVLINESPDLSLSASADTILSKDSVTVTASATGADILYWQSSAGTDTTSPDASLRFTPETPGAYVIRAKAINAAGCADSTDIPLVALPRPDTTMDIRLVTLEAAYNEVNGLLELGAIVENNSNVPLRTVAADLQLGQQRILDDLQVADLPPGEIALLPIPVDVVLNPNDPLPAACLRLRRPNNLTDIDTSDNDACAPIRNDLHFSQLYPNPTTGFVTVEATAATGEPLTLEVMNALGQNVLSRTLSPTDGFVQTELDFSGLSAGVYVVRLRQGEASIQRRVVRR
jgi:hypothetical protein